MFDTVSSRPFAVPGIATIAAAATLTPVMTSPASRIPAPTPVSLSNAAASIDADSILGAAASETFDSGDSAAADFIVGTEELLHYPLALIEWPIGFVPIVGGVVNGVLEAFWDLGVDLVNAPLIPAAEVLTGETSFVDGLDEFGARFVAAFTGFGEHLFGSVDGLLPPAPPTPFGADLSAGPGQLADASDAPVDADATEAFDPSVLIDLF